MNLVPIASIWAEDRNGVIGDGKQMLWHVPADFKHFRAATWGCPVIMGRKSWQALPKALPGRLNIVVSRQEDFRNQLEDAFVRGKYDFENSGSAVSDSSSTAQIDAVRTGNATQVNAVLRSSTMPANAIRAGSAVRANSTVRVADSLPGAIQLANQAISDNWLIPGKNAGSGNGGAGDWNQASGSTDSNSPNSSTNTNPSVDLVSLETAQRIWIIGGGQIYHQAMEFAQELVVTYIDLQTTNSTVKAPRIDPQLWIPSPALPQNLEWQPISGDARWKVVTWRKVASKAIPVYPKKLG